MIMKRFASRSLGLLVALSMFVGASVGAWRLVATIVEVFLSLQKEVAVAVVAGVVTVLGSVLSITIGKYVENRRTIEQEIRQKKIPVYAQFVDFWFTHFFKSSEKSKEAAEATEATEVKPAPAPDKEMIDFLRSFTKELLVWGSNDVVRKWSALRRKGISGKVDRQYMLDFEGLLKAMREDTGHGGTGLRSGDLLGLFINDVEDVLTPKVPLKKKKRKKNAEEAEEKS